MQSIHSAQIKNLVTKFYYRDNHLCFQILLHCEGDQTVAYQEFLDYSEYKSAYNKLLDAKSANEYILLPESKPVSTHVNFV